MRKDGIVLSLALVFALTGCRKEVMEVAPVSSGAETTLMSDAAIPGCLRIQVSDELADKLLSSKDEDGNILDLKSAGIDIPGMKVTSVKTTFMIGGKFERRQREAGLHRFFDVTYDKDETTLTKASSNLGALNGVVGVEPILRVKSLSVKMDDPYYTQQWHYYNEGKNGAVSGIDIGLQQAWDEYGVFGNKDVIVAIIDAGVQYDHPDLKDNIWVNEAELNGSKGVDDDRNGYKDDIYGFNFVRQNGTIHPEVHGTHVAGTVAAVNNNGEGVCGVAGGNAKEGVKGVRLMCLQMMDEEYEKTGAVNRYFQYAADNGAVIAQNSWGYDTDSPVMTMDESLKVSIDYFIKNAGMDENGRQVGPMKGGLVVFAAGNDSFDFTYPAAYEAVLAVAAVGPTGKAASYTNYGSWIEVCAPGGEQALGSYAGVFSTINGSRYSGLQGTSMACPHVSGVAALVLSACGGEGYTADDLYETICNSTDESIYDYNPKMAAEKQLGSGLIKANLALSSLNTIAPEPLTTLTTEVQSNTVHFTADVPSDDEGTSSAYYYHVYYSTSQFSASTLSSANKASFVVSKQENVEGGLKRFSLKGLSFNTKYYYCVSAGDFAGNESAPTDVRTLQTGSNTAPEVIPDFDPETAVVESWETLGFTFKSSDADGHDVTLSLDHNGLSERSLEFTATAAGEGQLNIIGPYSKIGENTCYIVATDAYGSRSRYAFKFVVRENHAPVLVKPVEALTINGIGVKASLYVNELFSDEDGETLAIVPSISDRNVVSFSYVGDVIVFTGKQIGVSTVKLVAADAKGESAECNFDIVVRDSSSPLDIYPNPVVDNLNVRTGVDIECKVSVYSASGATVYSADGVKCGLESPLKINMASAAPGVYNLVLESTDGQVFKGSFAKI